jgi:hypothetical protein
MTLLIAITFILGMVAGGLLGTVAERRATRIAALASQFCYAPHFDRVDHGLPNDKYQPHVHVPETDSRGRAVAVIWEPAPCP